MKHFAYPNVSFGAYLGCGRYVSWPRAQEPPAGYTPALADVSAPQVLNRAIQDLAPVLRSLEHDTRIYERRDPADQRYRGDSLNLAYLLVSLSGVWPLQLPWASGPGDIWCTGIITYAENAPWLEAVEPAGFATKLHAFVAKQDRDRLFIVPRANLTDDLRDYCRAQGVGLCTLDAGGALTEPEPAKLVLVVHGDELPRLVTCLFETPSGHGGSEQAVHVWLERLPIARRAEFFGRGVYLAQLDAAWRAPGTTVMSLIASGGVGKSALVAEWLRRMEHDGYRGARRVYGWSFYTQSTSDRVASAEAFIRDAFGAFNAHAALPGSAEKQGERLADLVREQPTLLILDGLEPFQYASGADQGRLKDRALKTLIRRLSQSFPRGLLVITSRMKITDIEERRYTTAPVIDLERLTREEGMDLLWACGARGTPAELQDAVCEYDGHALALILLGSYLADVYHGDIRRRRQIRDLTNDSQHGHHARKVMHAYERWFGRGPEVAILSLLGLFDRWADTPEVQALCAAPPIRGLTAAVRRLTPPQWHQALATLRRIGLLAKSAGPSADSTLDAHPLVREYFSYRLRTKNPTAFRAGHQRLFAYLSTSTPYHPNSYAEMEPLYTAIAHGCAAGRYQEAFTLYTQRIQRDDVVCYSTKVLGAIREELAAVSHFFVHPWTHPHESLTAEQRGYLLDDIGYNLRAVGQFSEADEAMQAGLAIWCQQGDWRRAAIAANNLSELALTSGKLEAALVYGRRSVELADQSEDAQERSDERTTLADALHNRGCMAEAAAVFEEAEAIQRQLDPGQPWLSGVQGVRYGMFLLTRGTYEEVIARMEPLVQGEESVHSLTVRGLGRMVLGQAYLLQAPHPDAGDIVLAGSLLDQAVSDLENAQSQDDLPYGLVARATLRIRQGDYEPAQDDLTEALALATRGDGMRLHEADCLLGFAQLHLAMGAHHKAREYLAQARGLIAALQYGRRAAEVTELQQQLGM